MHHGIDHPFEGHEIWKGVVAGAIGGLTAAWAMNMFMTGTTKLEQKVRREQQPPQQQSGDEDATVKTARAISESVGHPLREDEKKPAGSLVHYLFGSAMGALYGLVSEIEPRTRVGFGTAFGAALWLGADEVMVPTLKLGPKPNETPAQVHAKALAAHLVYGATAESVRRGVRAALDHDWRATGEEIDEYARESWPVKYVLQKTA
jgi:uncharacterized membrane protein YagU involved in acid resistance